ncbi:MAG: sigma-70 family RNA polymerase sigma factor [Phaeodactylibacter sp.]|nr:sigma-70 family RNA polymerase sigma factor [Phaeodactylibacter sp.]MCB9297327.1 sigma-70 family RNA polymerase sigma factor [Lewinellaceae bacterium]
MSKEVPYTDPKKLLEALRRGEERAFEQVYRSCYRQISSMARSNSGTESQAQDLFQETLLVFLGKLRDPAFELTSDVCTFLYAIAQRKWWKQLRKDSRVDLTLDEQGHPTELPDVGNLEEKKAFEEKHRLMSRVFAGISEECRRIIVEFYYQKKPLQEIAEKMGLDYQYIRVKKHRCMNDYKKRIRAHPDFKGL